MLPNNFEQPPECDDKPRLPATVAAPVPTPPVFASKTTKNDYHYGSSQHVSSTKHHADLDDNEGLARNTGMGSGGADVCISPEQTPEIDRKYFMPSFPFKELKRRRNPSLSAVYLKHLKIKDKLEEELMELPSKMLCNEAIAKISNFARQTRKMLSAIPSDTAMDHCQKSRLKHNHMDLKRLQQYYVKVMRL